jgi:hypothetical protein
MRFTGKVEFLCKVTKADLAIIKIGEGTSYDETCRPLAEKIIAKHFPGMKISGVGMWRMLAGRDYPDHKDEQPPYWITRVHIPLVTNPGVVFTVGGEQFHMKVGEAYQMNTLERHAVVNKGNADRWHMVFDVRTP